MQEDNIVEELAQEPQQQNPGDTDSVTTYSTEQVTGQQQDGAMADTNDGSDETAPEPVTLTDEDINSDLEDRKSRVQKRIDKLTAEKYGALEEVEVLRRELASVKEQIEASSKPKERKYTEEELKSAIEYGINEGSPEVIFQGIKELIKNEREKVLGEINGDNSEQQKRQQREAQLWSQLAESTKSTYDDKDYDLTDTNSAAYRYASHLWQQHAQTYSQKFGDYAKVQAANDAIRAVSELKARKNNSKQLRSTEKELATAKMKTQIPYGNASVNSSQPQPKNDGMAVLKDTNTNDALDSYINARKKGSVRFDTLRLVK